MLAEFFKLAAAGLSDDEDFVPPCTNYNPEWWYESIDSYQETPADRKQRHDQAKAVCKTCPARTACQTLAIEGNEWGIWGGRLFHAARTTGELPPSGAKCASCGAPLAGQQKRACSRECASRLGGGNIGNRIHRGRTGNGPISLKNVEAMLDASKTVHEIAEYYEVKPESLARKARYNGRHELSARLVAATKAEART